MKTVGILSRSLIVLSCLACLLSGQTASTPISRLVELNYFLGSWDCAGKFTRSGAAIEAHLEFEPILNRSFLLFRHDDKPPHGYHAWAEWGWDATGRQFVSTIQDSGGGSRVFISGGWQADRLVWEGGSLKGDGSFSNDQQFVFERVSPKQFRVSYAVRKEGAWAPVDSSTCSQLQGQSPPR